MSLSSAVRYKPFSHIPGTLCLIPGTNLAAQVFPSRYCIYDYSQKDAPLVETVAFQHSGPLEQFCVTQNLEKGKIEVTGFSKEGFVRYFIGPDVVFGARERLFLGVDKSQDWQMVQRRCNMNEVLPYLYWLSQSVPLPECESHVLMHDLKALYKAGFGHMMMPRLVDADHNGYELPIIEDVNQSPLILLKHMYRTIRSCFFQEDNGRMLFLPHLSQEQHSGVFVGVKTANGHTISLEWTKHLLRRVFIEAASDDTLTFEFQKPIKSVRIQKKRVEVPVVLSVCKGMSYLLDNIQK